jgi:hypothetical protein
MQIFGFQPKVDSTYYKYEVETFQAYYNHKLVHDEIATKEENATIA